MKIDGKWPNESAAIASPFSVARMARIPAKQVSASDRDVLRNLDRNLKMVVFGQDQAIEVLGIAAPALVVVVRGTSKAEPALIIMCGGMPLMLRRSTSLIPV